jgi:amicyanin
MTMPREEVTRFAATLIWLCAIGATGLTISCFSERTTGTADDCAGTAASPCVVEIRNSAFEPATLRVPAGATVTWVNRDALGHTSTSDQGVTPAWDSPVLTTNATFPRDFPTAGEFRYHCEPHPFMKGTIVVGQAP